MRATVYIPHGVVVGAGDYLGHTPDGTRPLPAIDGGAIPAGAFARVLDPTPGELSVKGYPVRCELMPRKTFG